MFFLYDILSTVVYSVLGIILMLLGNFLIDLVVPCHFPTEIKKGNKAVGWLSAGSFVGIGILIRAAVASPPVRAAGETFFTGIIGSLIYFAIGVAFFILGYFAVNIFNRRYNLSEEIGNGNESAGIIVCGIFVGLAIIISGVIYG